MKIDKNDFKSRLWIFSVSKLKLSQTFEERKGRRYHILWQQQENYHVWRRVHYTPTARNTGKMLHDVWFNKKGIHIFSASYAVQNLCTQWNRRFFVMILLLNVCSINLGYFYDHWQFRIFFPNDLAQYLIIIPYILLYVCIFYTLCFS